MDAQAIAFFGVLRTAPIDPSGQHSAHHIVVSLSRRGHIRAHQRQPFKIKDTFPPLVLCLDRSSAVATSGTKYNILQDVGYWQHAGAIPLRSCFPLVVAITSISVDIGLPPGHPQNLRWKDRSGELMALVLSRLVAECSAVPSELGFIIKDAVGSKNIFISERV